MVGADLARPSPELAQAAAERYGVANVQFVETDLTRTSRVTPSPGNRSIVMAGPASGPR